MSPQEFAQRIKAKNPHLSEVDDMLLVRNVLEAYPEYRNDVDLTEEIPERTVEEIHAEQFQAYKPEKKLNAFQKAGNFIVGAGKGLMSTIKNTSDLGERIIGAPVRAITGEKFESSSGKLQGIVEQKLGLEQGNMTEATNPWQKAGKFTEQVGEFLFPALKVSKLTSGANLATKLGARAGTSASVATLQEGEVGKETAIAGGAELLIPAGAKVLKAPIAIMKRLLKGVGTGLAGVGTRLLESISADPKTAIETSKIILKEGDKKILRQNADAILKGISRIRKEARGLYGKGVEALKDVDIKLDVIRKNTKEVLEGYGVKFDKGIDLSNSEIFDKGIQKKLKELITLVNEQVKPDGKKLRAVMQKLESSKFKTTGSDPNRLAFNAIVKDLTAGLKKSINESTDKLGKINTKFSSDMQLAEAMEKIFGKVKFKSQTELSAIAKKLESLFSQSGLDEETTENFLKRIGINPAKFKSSEATRQIYGVETGKNSVGLNPVEVIRAFTSAVVTPEAVKNMAIVSGLSEELLKAIAKYANPAIRSTIIKSLTNYDE